jgi:hypothetical protein
VRITYTYGEGCEELIIASAYLPYDSDEPLPTRKVRDIIGYCCSWKKQLISGCDAKSHHIFWGEHRHQSKRRKLRGISGEFEPEYSLS